MIGIIGKSSVHCEFAEISSLLEAFDDAVKVLGAEKFWR